MFWQIQQLLLHIWLLLQNSARKYHSGPWKFWTSPTAWSMSSYKWTWLCISHCSMTITWFLQPILPVREPTKHDITCSNSSWTCILQLENRLQAWGSALSNQHVREVVDYVCVWIRHHWYLHLAPKPVLHQNYLQNFHDRKTCIAATNEPKQWHAQSCSKQQHWKFSKHP